MKDRGIKGGGEREKRKVKGDVESNFKVERREVKDRDRKGGEERERIN